MSNESDEEKARRAVDKLFQDNPELREGISSAEINNLSDTRAEYSAEENPAGVAATIQEAYKTGQEAGVDQQQRSSWEVVNPVHSTAISVDENTNHQISPESQQAIGALGEGYQSGRLSQQYEQQAQQQQSQVQEELGQEDWTGNGNSSADQGVQQTGPEPEQDRSESEQSAQELDPNDTKPSVFERYGKRPPEQEQAPEKEQDRDEPTH